MEINLTELGGWRGYCGEQQLKGRVKLARWSEVGL